MNRSRFLLLLIFALLWYRYVTFTSWHGDEYLRSYVDEKVRIEGIIVDEPVPKDKNTKLIVQIEKIEEHNVTNTKTLVYDAPYSERKFGDRVIVEGKLAVPRDFEGDAGKEFKYEAYLAKDRIFYQINFAKVTLVEEKQGSNIKAGIFFVKNKVIQALKTSLPFPESSLASGLVVAGKGALPKAIQDNFQITGTIQVVVLSGYNVMLIAQAIILLFSKLPKLLSISLSAITIILFCIAAGGSATIVRAVVMVIIALISQPLHRKYNVGRGLVAAAVIMLFMNPMLLFFDPSFQLSFLATAGLIYATPIASKHFGFITEKFNLREVLASSIATQVFVTPFLIYLTGTVSLVAIPANLALSVLVPIAMFGSFITAFFGLFSTILAMPASFISFLFLKTILIVVDIFAKVPYASVLVGLVPGWFVLLIYIYFVYVLVKFHKKRQDSSSAIIVDTSL
jgi:competence protein ComEC